MRTRWIAIVVALVGAVLLALSAIEAWWRAGEVAIGPFGSHHCFGGDCKSSGLAWIGGTDLWLRSAVATRAAAIIASILLVVVAGGLAARRVPRLIARSTLVALAAAVVTGSYFVAKFPSLGGTSLDLGAFLYGGGVVMGLVAAVLTLRFPITADP